VITLIIYRIIFLISGYPLKTNEKAGSAKSAHSFPMKPAAKKYRANAAARNITSFVLKFFA